MVITSKSGEPLIVGKRHCRVLIVGNINSDATEFEITLFFWVPLIFANIFVGAKHFGSKSLVLTNKLSAEMLRPCPIEIHPEFS